MNSFFMLLRTMVIWLTIHTISLNVLGTVEKCMVYYVENNHSLPIVPIDITQELNDDVEDKAQ